MNRADAQKLLGLLDDETMSVQSIRAMWATKVREYHSDTSKDGTSNAEMLGKLSLARDVLLEQRVAPAARCKLCRGTGMVRGKRFQELCRSCDGTGDVVRA